jgi:hypothetical protein
MFSKPAHAERSHLLYVGALARIEAEHPTGDIDVEGIVSVVDDKRVTIRFRDLQRPLSELLPAGGPAILKLWDRFGMHRAEVPVHSVIEDGHSAAVILATPARFVGTQTRRFVRISARLELTLERPGAKAPARAERALSCDVSAGGLSFLSDSAFEIDDHVQVTMMLPKEVVSLAALDLSKIDTRVVRTESVPETARRFFGVEFQNVTQRQRDRLIEVMLGLQRIVR